MTDARLPERYLMDRRITRLSDADFRAFVMATLWSVSNRTDGVVEREDLALIPGFTHRSTSALENAGLWDATVNGWSITDFDATQTSRSELEVLDNARRADRDKKRRLRATKKAESPTFTEVPGDDPGDVSRGTTQERTGQARQGQAEYLGNPENNNSEVVNFTTGEVTDPSEPRYEFVRDGNRVTRQEVKAS